MPDSATILLVDDEESVQKLLTYPLERDGYRVIQARDGDEALARFASEPVDLVVLDVMLPRLDGLEVCKRLRARSSVPIVMLTARDDELDKVVGLELGADDYITKPFSIREFRSRVRALLRRASAPRHQPPGEEVIEIEGLPSTPAAAWSSSTGGRSSSPTSSSSCCVRSRAARAGCSRGKRCWRRSAAGPSIGSRARSTSTSATFARSSSEIRAIRSSS